MKTMDLGHNPWGLATILITLNHITSPIEWKFSQFSRTNNDEDGLCGQTHGIFMNIFNPYM